MNQHVHASRYSDYLLAARYDQMARCYQMSMEEFLQAGLGWFVRTMHVDYKRPLVLGEVFIVRTWVEEITGDSVRVEFQILKKKNHKLASDGYAIYTLVNLSTNRAEKITGAIFAKYAI